MIDKSVLSEIMARKTNKACSEWLNHRNKKLKNVVYV